jgi:hypothetical protein
MCKLIALYTLYIGARYDLKVIGLRRVVLPLLLLSDKK